MSDTNEHKAKITRFQFYRIILLSVVAVFLILYGVILIVLEKHGSIIITLDKSEKPDIYKQQIAALTEVEKNLDNLNRFIKQQKQQLNDSQTILNDLRVEHEKLKPIVSEDEKVVNAILEAQQEHQRKSVWIDRGFGFVAGVFSSMLASLLIGFVARKWKKPKQE